METVGGQHRRMDGYDICQITSNGTRPWHLQLECLYNSWVKGEELLQVLMYLGIPNLKLFIWYAY